MQSSTPIGSVGFLNNFGLICPREWGAFPKNEMQTIPKSTEIGTALAKIIQQNLNIPLSNLRSLLSALRSTLTYLSSPPG